MPRVLGGLRDFPYRREPQETLQERVPFEFFRCRTSACGKGEAVVGGGGELAYIEQHFPTVNHG